MTLLLLLFYLGGIASGWMLKGVFLRRLSKISQEIRRIQRGGKKKK